jgi:hypothetical protein
MKAKIDRNRALVPLFALAALTLFAGCDKDPLGADWGEGEEVQLERQASWEFVVEPEIADMAAGETLQLRAYLRHPLGGPLRPAEAEWVSEDPKAAMVTKDGLVEAYAAGPVIITAFLKDAPGQGPGIAESARARILVR